MVSLVGNLSLSINSSDTEWIAATYDIAEKAVCDYFGLDALALANAIVQLNQRHQTGGAGGKDRSIQW